MYSTGCSDGHAAGQDRDCRGKGLPDLASRCRSTSRLPTNWDQSVNTPLLAVNSSSAGTGLGQPGGNHTAKWHDPGLPVTRRLIDPRRSRLRRQGSQVNSRTVPAKKRTGLRDQRNAAKKLPPHFGACFGTVIWVCGSIDYRAFRFRPEDYKF